MLVRDTHVPALSLAACRALRNTGLVISQRLPSNTAGDRSCRRGNISFPNCPSPMEQPPY